ncbi:PspA/IM30 family protein [soil metagenome]
MRLFRRVSDILSANLNDLVDRFEDPEVMLKQAIREMETSISPATAATARAIAHERLLAQEQGEHDRQVEHWQFRAELAVEAGDDNLARRALARKQEHEALAGALREQWSSARQLSLSLRRQLEAMRAKHAEARRLLAGLTARARAAEASLALRGFVSDSGTVTNGFARFEQLRGRVELAEAEAVALLDLHTESAEELESAFMSREADRRIEAELLALKERLQMPRDSAS